MSTAKILVVDDTPTNLKLLFDYLETRGFKILVATNGQNALRQAKRTEPDLILLDVMMPGMDGFETCRRLKADDQTKEIPVIFMTALPDVESKITGFEVGGVDYITKPFYQQELAARIQTHLTIHQQRRQLKELNDTKDRFFSIIAHDIRGSLIGLLGYSEVLAESVAGYSPDQIQTFARELFHSARHTTDLLDNLLTWARLQQGHIDVQPRALNLADIVIDNILLLKANATQKNISLTSSIEPNTRVFADSNALNTVLRNLITNAIKFTHPGGSVTVSSTIRDTFVEIGVKDTGIGIQQTNIPKLFRIDSKFKKYGTADERGTGLGLLLCKELLEKCGGKIWVESKENKGSTFWFTLPKTTE